MPDSSSKALGVRLVTQAVLGTLTVLMGAGVTAESPSLEPLWTVEGFRDPESAAIDLKRQVIYVSNVNTYAKDNNGAISRVSLDGSRVELDWITHIDSPTGVAIFEDRLYFADFDSLVAADIDSGEILHRFPAPDDRPVLNDVAISSEGDVYVSGSRSRTIYRLENGKRVAWLHDEELLVAANGLLVYPEGFLFHGGEHWSALHIGKRKPVVMSPSPSEGLRDFDGITALAPGRLLVTMIDDPRIWLVTSRVSRPLSEEPIEGIDLDYRAGFLAVPRVGGKLTLFRLGNLPVPGEVGPHN